MSNLRCLSVAAVSSIASSFASGEVLVVAPTGAPFQEIWQAVDASASGDIILVRSGTYGGILLQGKGLHVIADAGAVVQMGPILVYDLPSDETLTLAGLNASLPAAGVELYNCAGRVRVSDCSFGGFETFLTYPPPPPIYIWQCADVTFNACTLAGADDHFQGGSTGPHVERSNVTFVDSTIVGGVGPDGRPPPAEGLANEPGQPGLAAVHAKNSSLAFIGCSLRGGAGGRGVDSDCDQPNLAPSAGGAGGPAVTAFDQAGAASTIVRRLDTVVVRSPGGAGGRGPCGDAPDGTSGGGIGVLNVVSLAGVSRSLAPIAPAREGESLLLHFEGLPGDRVTFAMAADAGQHHASFFHGQHASNPPPRRFFIDTIGPSGVLDVALPVKELGAGIDARLRHGEATFVDASGVSWLSGSSPVLMLDSSL